MIWFFTLNSTGIYREIGRISKSLGSCSQDNIQKPLLLSLPATVLQNENSKALFAKYEGPKIKCALIGKKKRNIIGTY